MHCMLNIINFKLYKAIFVSEGKSRFVCNISYNDEVLECYVPITCKLSSLISLDDKEILIRATTKAAKRIKYTLFAVRNNKDYLIVDTGFANHIVKAILTGNINKDLFYPEQVIENYKCDFYSKTSKTLVEVKSVITAEQVLLIPNMKTQRAIKQLQRICSLLSKGYRAEYFIVAFAPQIEKIEIDTTERVGQLLAEVSRLGGKITCIKISLNETYRIYCDELNYLFI